MSPLVEKLLLFSAGAIGGWLFKILKGFFKSLLAGRGKIKRTIESGINNELKSAIKEACGLDIFKQNIKIEWAEKVDKNTYLNKEGDIVIKLSYADDRNQSRSFSKALMLYLEEAFIPEGRPFIGNEIHQGCKLTLAKEVTLKKDAESYRHFLAAYLSPLLMSDHSLEILMNKLELLSQHGIFRNILLRELYILSGKGILPKAEMRNEVKDFIDFLWNIADKRNYFRKYGVEPPLSFIQKYIKIDLVLVKRKQAEDIAAHIYAVECAFNNGALTVYITGWGEDNIGYTKKILREIISRNRYRKICETKFNAEFEDSIKAGICYTISR
jgi:hypothetical protein